MALLNLARMYASTMAYAGFLAFTLSLPVAATSATKAPPSGSAAPRLMDFKGVPLEITIDEFRALPHPDGEAAKVVCSGDTVMKYGKPSQPSDLYVDDNESALGIKKCVWYGRRYETLPDTTIPLNLPIEGYIVGTYTFDFIPDPNDGKLRFFRFFGTSHTNANADVIAALTQKFGRPVAKVETVQNGLGATFPSATNMWANKLSILTVKEKWTEITKMAIMLTDNRLLQIVSDANAARAAKVKHPI